MQKHNRSSKRRSQKHRTNPFPKEIRQKHQQNHGRGPRQSRENHGKNGITGGAQMQDFGGAVR